MKALQGRTAFGQTPPAKPLQGRQHGRKSAAATGSAGHREIARGVAPGVEGSGGLSYHTSRSKDRSLRQLLQKIAFPCRSCRRLRSFDSGFRSCGDPINRAHTKTPMTHWPSAFSYLEGVVQAADQNAGSTAPLYFFSMNALTSGLVRAAASFLMASLFLLSSRATRKFT